MLQEEEASPGNHINLDSQRAIRPKSHAVEFCWVFLLTTFTTSFHGYLFEISYLTPLLGSQITGMNDRSTQPRHIIKRAGLSTMNAVRVVSQLKHLKVNWGT